jgi:hypothetical protein
MGFELIPGWTPEEPAPTALCDNPACPDPIMPATGWVIAALVPTDAARPGLSPAVHTYLACGESCLAAIRQRLGGAWTAPLPYAAYWRAVGPRVVAELTETERARLTQVRMRRQARTTSVTSPATVGGTRTGDDEGQAPMGDGLVPPAGAADRIVLLAFPADCAEAIAREDAEPTWEDAEWQ